MTGAIASKPPPLPLTLAWSPPPRPGRTLFVVFAYHGSDRDAAGRGRALLAWIDPPAARGHRIVHRDHYANPRPLTYLLAMIETASALLMPDGQPDLVLDDRFAEGLPDDMAAQFGRIETSAVAKQASWGSGLLAASRHYGNLVLVYPDALGLGCEAGEAAARRSGSTSLILNGRRRAFRLNRANAARLVRSRFLARTRIVERLLALTIVPVAIGLAGLDRLRRARHG